MKYAIYEDPITHRFAHLPLPSRYVDGDELPAVVTDRWFDSHDAALAGLIELLDRDEAQSASIDDAEMAPAIGETHTMSSPLHPVHWFRH
jgi:hypothetical protein